MTARLRGAMVLWLSTTVAGCPIGDDKYPKPSELSPEWRIDGLRVLAIKAEPPEVRPGETARFSALLTDPKAEAGAVVWLACPVDDGGIGFGCSIDPSFDFANATPDQLAAAGFIGFEPFLAPTYTAPLDALDGLDSFQAADGVYVLVQVAALPRGVIEGGPAADFDFNQVEVGYKRLVVSSVEAPNVNPIIESFTVDGYPVPLGTVLEVDRDQSYEIGAVLRPGSDENYVYTNKIGVTERRHEEPWVAWYGDAGTVEEPVTLFGYLESTWVSPSSDSEPEVTSGTLWAVVRDRRGGMNWATLPWRLRD